jgi:hypothetical protein
VQQMRAPGFKPDAAQFVPVLLIDRRRARRWSGNHPRTSACRRTASSRDPSTA